MRNSMPKNENSNHANTLVRRIIPKIVRNILITVPIFVSCNNDRIDKKIEDFYASKILFPTHRMIKKDCSLYHDQILDSSLVLVKYVEVHNCFDCKINQLAQFDYETYSSGSAKKISIVYIVNIPKELDTSELYNKLCAKRIRGTVYLDTCNTFMEANPHIPDNPMFHTFLLNEENEVILIGDPFVNEKMNGLLEKVINKKNLSKSLL